MSDATLRYAGAKWALADWIIASFPPGYQKMTYLEPFFGSGAVFFSKGRSVMETINDADGDIVNLFRILRDRAQELATLVSLTPWAREELDNAWTASNDKDDLERARQFLVKCWQGMQSRIARKPGWANEIDFSKKFSSYQSRWNKLPGFIAAAAARLKDAQIEHKDALELIERYRNPGVLIYADPPYLASTRSSGSLYRHEMSNEEHEELLWLLTQHPGPVLLSAYPNELYANRLQGWTQKVKSARAGSQSRKSKDATEVLWLNQIAAERCRQQVLAL